MKLNKNLNILILFSLAPLLMTTSYSNQIYYNVASVINTVDILFTFCASYNFYTRIKINETSHTVKIYKEMNNIRESIFQLVYEMHLRDIQNKIKQINYYPDIEKSIQMLRGYQGMIDIGYGLLIMNDPAQLDQLCKQYSCSLSQQFKKDVIQFRNLYVKFFNTPNDMTWRELSAMKDHICCSELDTFRHMIKSNILSIMDGNHISYTNSTRQYEIWNTESQV